MRSRALLIISPSRLPLRHGLVVSRGARSKKGSDEPAVQAPPEQGDAAAAPRRRPGLDRKLTASGLDPESTLAKLVKGMTEEEFIKKYVHEPEKVLQESQEEFEKLMSDAADEGARAEKELNKLGLMMDELERIKGRIYQAMEFLFEEPTKNPAMGEPSLTPTEALWKKCIEENAALAATGDKFAKHLEEAGKWNAGLIEQGEGEVMKVKRREISRWHEKSLDHTVKVRDMLAQIPQLWYPEGMPQKPEGYVLPEGIAEDYEAELKELARQFEEADEEEFKLETAKFQKRKQRVLAEVRKPKLSAAARPKKPRKASAKKT